MKNRIIEICELGQPQSIIHRENQPITELIKTTDLVEELNEQLRLGVVSFSLRDKFAMEAMNGELSSQGGIDGCVWANERELAERAYLVADAMIKARSNES